MSMFNHLSSVNPNSQNEQKLNIVKDTTMNGGRFVKDFYYHLYDTNRKDLITLYKDSSISVWNGTECKGVEKITGLLSEIPASIHTIECFDTQPYNSPEDKGQPNILISVSGKVTYNQTSSHNFHQTFILLRDPTTSNFFISYDCLRLTS